MNPLKKYAGFVTKKHISKLENREDIKGKVKRIFLPFNIKIKNYTYRAQRILLTNEDNNKRYVILFWNNDKLKEIKIGDKIEFINIKYNHKYNEHYYDSLTQTNILTSAQITPLKNLKDGLNITEGKIVELYPVYYYKYGNTEKRMYAFKLMQSKYSKLVIIWQNPINLKKLEVGQRIRIENGMVDGEEIHINLISRIIITQRGG